MKEIWGTVGPRGSEHFSCEGMSDWEWARCHKAGCLNFVCVRLSDIWCYQHADGLPSLGEIIEALPAETLSEAK